MIDTGQLRVYYQPIADTLDGSIVSAEALVRWEHPTRGLLAPDRFLPAFARDGSLPTLDRWVFGQACHDLAELRHELGVRAPQWVNVNISRASLRTDFDAMISDVLATTGITPGRLRMELPEDADLPALTEVADRLARLGDHGVRFTLDDMGTGATNLRYMSALPIHGFKIDRMFVAGMADSAQDRTIVQLLADLGQRLGLRVTAEGVENPAQLRMLAELGVAYAQGYHISAPLPRQELTEFLTREPELSSVSG
ncbi:EAL domain-containing protein [Hamadaea sp. NPDC051192]|uniref:EAL domain-containing protein n=1 Tax=Hamadaea sp. NPDC051192 TaxID=3154940 RepID=UPI00342A5BA0